MIRKFKVDNTELNKIFNIKGRVKETFTINTDGTNIIPPWNAGKKGLQVSNKKDGNRPDLTPTIRKRIAEKVKAFHTGRKRSLETRQKISMAMTGKPRPDMVGNKLSSGNRDNSIFRTPEFRKLMSERAKMRWAKVSSSRQVYA
tara:strand:+ start:364 stop:795 length:432 start_codon:yes stop_codon:yes gene_type:complete